MKSLDWMDKARCGPAARPTRKARRPLDLQWTEGAVCAQTDPDLFYPEWGHHSGAVYKQAITVCAGCPVRAECAEYGRDEEYGVWGGMTPNQRAKARRTGQDSEIRVSAWGTVRRVQSLTALGFGVWELAELCRVSAVELQRLRRGDADTVDEATHAEIRELFENNRDRQPQRPDRCALLAATRGRYPTPPRWDGRDMDNPMARARQIGATA